MYRVLRNIWCLAWGAPLLTGIKTFTTFCPVLSTSVTDEFEVSENMVFFMFGPDLSPRERMQRFKKNGGGLYLIYMAVR